MQMGPLEMSGHRNRTLAFREKNINNTVTDEIFELILFLLLWPGHSQIDNC